MSFFIDFIEDNKKEHICANSIKTSTLRYEIYEGKVF